MKTGTVNRSAFAGLPAAAAGFLLLAACGDNPVETAARDGAPAALLPGQTDICDARGVMGVCYEYPMTELSGWFVKYVEATCPKKRQLKQEALYRKNVSCPISGRIATCARVVENPQAQYIYDIHYYPGTRGQIEWKASDVEVSCRVRDGVFSTASE